MLKKRFAWVLFASIFLVVAVICSIKIVEYYEPTQQQAEQQAKNQSEINAVNILASERVAYYTKVLAIFTGILSAFGLLQIFFLIRADQTTRTSADAAKESADAVRLQARIEIKARLPVVGWAGAKLAEIRNFSHEHVEKGVDPVEPGLPPVISEPLPLLKNAGPTNIAVTHTRFRWKVTHQLPLEPFYEGMLPIGYFMEVTAQWITLNDYITLSEAERESIKHGREHLWFYGFCRYNDFLDEWHTVPFCYRWDLRRGFVRDGPPSYWQNQHEKNY